MNLYVDDTIGRIQKCVNEKKVVSQWIEEKLDNSLRKINRCLFPAPRLHDTEGGNDGVETWLLFEAVPVNGYLPAFQQRHNIRFKLGQPAPCTCSCPYFTSTRLPCNAMCALFSTKNIQTIEAISHHMDEMWLIRGHPIYTLAMSLEAARASGVGVVVPPVASQNVTAVSETITRSNADAMRSVQLPTDVGSRRVVLSNLFAQVLSRTAACSAFSRDMHDYLVQHRSKLAQSQSVFVPPTSQISAYQSAAGMGPAADVPNRANITYNPAKKGRVRIARNSDPSKYSTFRSAGHNMPVKCLCGLTYNNEKKAAFSHRKSKEHAAWLAQYLSDMAAAAVAVDRPAVILRAHAPVTPESSDAEETTALPSHSVIEVHRQDDDAHGNLQPVYQQKAPGPGLIQYLATLPPPLSPSKRGRQPSPPPAIMEPSWSPPPQTQDNVEADDIINLVKPSLDYYRRFTNSVRMCDNDCVQMLERCYVSINGRLVDAIVGGAQLEGVNQLKDRRYILCYTLFDQHGRLMGFFSSGRVIPRNEGWRDPTNELEEILVVPAPPSDAVEIAVLHRMFEPLCVVLTGTFPELGGGSGLLLGKEALKRRVLQVPGARVVSAISGKTTHLVTGKDPGQKKILDAQAQEFPKHVLQLELQPFLELLAQRMKDRQPVYRYYVINFYIYFYNMLSVCR